MKIKICGIFRVEDAAAVNTALPDFAGFVFVPESRRRVTPEAAAALRKKIDARVMTVGVFRNAPPPFVSALVRAGTIGAVQLHGDEDAPYTSALRAEPGMDGAPIIKAISVTGAATHGDGPFGSRQAATQKDRPHGLLSCPADFLLFDNGTGGTGKRFDTGFIRAAMADGTLAAKPFFIAGGVNESNIGEIIALGPYGIDISSGAETGGAKDAAKIARLVGAVRAAGR